MEDSTAVDLDNNGRDTIRILMVGRDGNGKTSCIKSIESVEHDDSEIIAVKCPGVGDIGDDRTEDIHTVINNVEKEVKLCEKYGGFNAIAFVIKYGVRFTKQEKDAVEDVKCIFGRDVFSKNGIIIMTYGDMFDMDNEDERKTFTDWRRDQSGDIEKLFLEVNYRVVLFDNKTKDTEKKSTQVESLLKLCNGIRGTYTTVQFDKARQERMQLVSREKYSGVAHGEAVRGSHPLTDQDIETSTMTTMRTILVGRDGNGKSSCVTSITKVKRQHRAIIAEKCNGVGDTGEDLTISIGTVEKNMASIMNSCSVLGGFNAIVFVLKYGVRFTKQEKDAVDAVRSMLGDDVFLNYGIILMTYGDLFDMDHEDGRCSFMDWCRYQTGDIQSLFEEVNYRIVLFYNKTKDISKLEQQYDRLYDILSSMTMT